MGEREVNDEKAHPEVVPRAQTDHALGHYERVSMTRAMRKDVLGRTLRKDA